MAPPDYHLVLCAKTMRLDHGPKENRHRPAIDPMFRSAAEMFGKRVAGVLLTGNLDDGVSGLRWIQERGGLVIVQDPEEAPFPEMPHNALQALKPDFCLKLKEIEGLLAHLPDGHGGRMKEKQRRSSRARGAATQAVEEKEGGDPVGLVCPECNGPLWEFGNGKMLRYECLVGHRYSLDTLLAAQAEELETALWIALRTIEERIRLQQRLMSQSQQSGARYAVKAFTERIAENKKSAQVLRNLLEKLPRPRRD